MKTTSTGLVMLAVLCCPLIAAAQSAPAPLPVFRPGVRTEQQVIESQQAAFLRQVRSNPNDDTQPRARLLMGQIASPLTKEEKARLKPTKEQLAEYAAFLEMPHTGILRLLPGDDCVESLLVVNAGDDCTTQTLIKVPGGGTYYSFRVKSHNAGPWSDIKYRDDKFHISANDTLGLLASLGETPLEDVTLETAGVQFIKSYVPATRYEEVLRQHKQAAKGIASGNFTYSLTQKAETGRTYLLRTIAYRTNGRVMIGDKRIDMIVAFKMVQKMPDGSIIILWKELARKKAPELERVAKK